MTEEQDKLLHEVHDMLTDLRADVTEIVTYIRKVQSAEYRDNEDTKQFCINAVANIFVDGMEESQKRDIGNNFNK